MNAFVVGATARVAVALRDKRPASPRGHRLARNAEAWLRENLTQPLTIRDICAALHTSERTLHAAFREHLGTTPKAFVKALRLRAARQDLLHPGPYTRVTDVALRWCFLHFGWFAHDYHALFGETPIRTLRRATRRPALVVVRGGRLDAAMGEGGKAFVKSWEELMAVLTSKRAPSSRRLASRLLKSPDRALMPRVPGAALFPERAAEL